MENLQEFIRPELLAVVPVLYLVGIWMRRSEKVSNTRIPSILGAIGIALAVLYTFSSVPVNSVTSVMQALFTSITQGVLCAGAAVYANQLYKQSRETKNGAELQTVTPGGAASS